MPYSFAHAVLEFRHLRNFVAPAEEGGGDVRKYAAERGIAEEEALKNGMKEKPKEFVEKGAVVYAKV